MRTRREVLGMALVAPLAAACAPDLLLGNPGAVRIGVSWSGSELAAFRTVLARLGYDRPVDVVPLGDDIETAFTAGGRSAPDIVMLPRAGRVRPLAEQRKLRPVGEGLWSDELGPRYPDVWRQLLQHNGKPYGVPFKAADKSLVWYNRQLVAEYGLGDPAGWTLADWLDRMEVLAETPVRLLALGAADGWVLTDVFENALLAESPRIYDEVAVARDNRVWESPAVRAAFDHLGSLWGHRHAFPGGIAGALTKQFPDAVREVFEHRRAVMVVEADFAEPIVRAAVRRSGRRVEDVVGVAAFPAVAAGLDAPRIVGGDVMVVTESANDRAMELVALLAAPSAPLPWIEEDGGFIAPNLRTSARYSPFLEPSARSLGRRTAFDLSDRIGAVGGRNGLWRILTDFLVTVGDGKTERLEAATDRAIAALGAVDQGRR
ncbi:carbohydrate ABC transporter substrate-binding protein (CUT1 family) [Nocardia tenerifensis]|uniref:Carbohydrate ABC transporter substrate-binding protein (CUT1 family) n=1 Tax=Nocardia tenerifensis TaxID=228006 RepID=A0A318JUK0_9NOCA|nr:extracellular solute-binding protein [Nocardia tenerifensis]PXX59123.1 carbohydrate ABC transporter substrate-binding protein (CUT1 family) [Nocardia tenerifensis]